jgi:hypothetical protein
MKVLGDPVACFFLEVKLKMTARLSLPSKYRVKTC